MQIATDGHLRSNRIPSDSPRISMMGNLSGSSTVGLGHCTVRDTARDMALLSPLPVYAFMYDRGSIKLPMPIPYTAVMHGSELSSIFGAKTKELRETDIQYQNQDRDELDSTMRAYWTNFATFGNPNGVGLPVWPQFASANHSTMVFGAGSRVEKGVRHDACDFWDRFGGGGAEDRAFIV